MDRTLVGLANTVYQDVNEKTPTDLLTLAKIKTFVNRSYKEVARREKEKEIELDVIDGTFNKPQYYKKGLQLVYTNEGKKYAIDFEEIDTQITCDYSGTMKFIYEYDNQSLPDLTDNEEPFTEKENDEAIMANARYLYWKSEGKYDKAEVEKRDFETSYIRRPVRILQFKIIR
jgi:hypothetical protein